MNYDSRKFKVGERLRIKGTQIKATVQECIQVDKKWQYKLEGWPNPVEENKLSKLS